MNKTELTAQSQRNRIIQRRRESSEGFTDVAAEQLKNGEKVLRL